MQSGFSLPQRKKNEFNKITTDFKEFIIKVSYDDICCHNGKLQEMPLHGI